MCVFLFDTKLITMALEYGKDEQHYLELACIIRVAWTLLWSSLEKETMSAAYSVHMVYIVLNVYI